MDDVQCQKCGCPLFTVMRSIKTDEWVVQCDNCGAIYPVPEEEA